MAQRVLFSSETKVDQRQMTQDTMQVLINPKTRVDRTRGTVAREEMA